MSSIVQILYVSHRKHSDELYKKKMDTISKDLVISFDKVKGFSKWDLEEKKAIKEVQSDITKSYVDEVKEHLKIKE